MKFFIDHPLNLLLLATAFLSGALLFFPALLRRGAAALSVLEATQLMNRKHAIVLDLRTESQFAQGHLLNARHLPAAKLAQATNVPKPNLPKNKATPLLLVGENDQQVATQVRWLQQQGYTEAHALAGGYRAWVAAGMPIQKGK